KPPFGGPEAVLAYLSRYTHRIAIANSRLLAFDGERVTFKWKDYRAKRDAPLQAYDARCRRVHPPLPDPCAARRIPPHPALRPLRQRQPGRQYRIGPPVARRTRPAAVKRGQRRHRKSSRRQRVERLSLLRRAYDHHRDFRTRLPAATVVQSSNRLRQLMTITPLSPSPIAVPVPGRYLIGDGYAPPTATVSAAFGRQNLEHRTPDHRADRIQGGQSQRPAGHSTVVLSGTDKSD